MILPIIYAYQNSHNLGQIKSTSKISDKTLYHVRLEYAFQILLTSPKHIVITLRQNPEYVYEAH